MNRPAFLLRLATKPNSLTAPQAFTPERSLVQSQSRPPFALVGFQACPELPGPFMALLPWPRHHYPDFAAKPRR